MAPMRERWEIKQIGFQVVIQYRMYNIFKKKVKTHENIVIEFSKQMAEEQFEM